jgi:dienelactone hydrolase
VRQITRLLTGVPRAEPLVVTLDDPAGDADDVLSRRHGFAVPDNPIYNAEANVRHWEALHQLYRAHLQDT